MTTPVDLVVNTYERTYGRVLQPGFFHGIQEQCRFPFEGRVALINNVEDEGEARRRAEALVGTGELTGFELVRERLPAALQRTGLRERDLGDARHWTDAPLVAVTLAGAPWLVYWDADVYLVEPADWITPSIELMERDPRVFCANPDNLHHPVRCPPAARTASFARAPGFSDQLFLVRRADFSAPIYGQRCITALRGPMAHVAHVFEMRVDSYMRHTGRLRASHLGSRYAHPPETAGLSYPSLGPRARLRRARNMAVVAYLRNSPRWLRPRCARDLGPRV